MKTNRRMFLRGAAISAASLASGSALAQNLLTDFISSSRRSGWHDQFVADVSPEGSVVSNVPVISPQTAGYVRQALGTYQQIVSAGGWPMVPDTGKKLQLGVVDPDVEVLRRRLMISGDLSRQAGMSQAFDTYVDSALKHFQGRHGVPTDGVMGKYTYAAMNVRADVRLSQLQTNLGRLESMGDLGQRYVMVNIPATQIEAVENGRVYLRNAAIVGKIDRQTPELDSKINEIIINPYWNAPISIVKKDIIPIVRKDPDYLKKANIHLLGPDGQEVDPTTIDWSTQEAAQYRFRQDPGKVNAMASVKINFPNKYSVYMHDTPEQRLFRDEDRFYSSGCVRVQNVRDLVSWLLRGTPGWDRQRFEQTIQTGENVSVPLADQVPVHFVYISAWATPQGVVHFRDDIYGRDGASELQASNTF